MSTIATMLKTPSNIKYFSEGSIHKVKNGYFYIACALTNFSLNIYLHGEIFPTYEQARQRSLKTTKA